MRSLHDRPGQDVERLVTVMAVPTANQVVFILTLHVLDRSAQRAIRAVREPDVFKVVDTGLLVGKSADDFEQVHDVSP